MIDLTNTLRTGNQPKLLQVLIPIVVLSSLFALIVYSLYYYQPVFLLSDPVHNATVRIFQIILGFGAGMIGIFVWVHFYKFKEESFAGALKLFPLHRPLPARLCIFGIVYGIIAVISLYPYHLAPNGFMATTLVILSLLMFLIVIFPSTSTIGQSMQPAILPGDAIVNERITQLIHGRYKRGDIINFCISKEMIAFIPPVLADTKLFQPATLLLRGIFLNKRIVALPGEKIEIKDGKLYINGEILNETWATGFTYTLKNLSDIGFDGLQPYPGRDNPVEVPEDHYFVLADNHSESSLDSHIFGFVSYSSISNRLLWIIWRNGKFHFSPLL